jgi:hypothetical protein
VGNLSGGDQELEDNIISLFKNADNIDPVKLRQMIADPLIRDKLLSKSVDPVFLEALLDKNSKTDINLLRETLSLMPDSAIEESLRADPGKSIDFKSLAKLFDKNDNADPVLIAKMLDPDIVQTVYAKGNDTSDLNKLIEKGS